MQFQKESRLFLQKLLQNPPTLPFDPKLLSMLFAVTQEGSNASTRSVVALLEQSQRLAARVLTVANSAAYGLEFKVSTLQKAINILGLREVRLLVLMVGMSSFLREVKLPGSFRVEEFWRHHLKVAEISRALVLALEGPSGPCGPAASERNRLSAAPDEMYIAGLLHDVGKVFLAASRPDIWEAVELRRECSHSWFEAENACCGMDHGLIGAAVLHHWKLPLILTEPVNLHHSPDMASMYGMETRLLAAADILAHSKANLEEGVCAEALSFLPSGCDAASLGHAVALCVKGTEGASCTDFGG